MTLRILSRRVPPEAQPGRSLPGAAAPSSAIPAARPDPNAFLTSPGTSPMPIASNSPVPLTHLSQATRAEIEVLRLAAGILDLQRTASPSIRELASVQALMHAAEAVFDELGFGDEPDRALSS